MITDADVYDLAARIRRALTDLGHCYQTKAGETVEISYRHLALAGDRYAVLELDTSRLPRGVCIPDLETDKVLSHLSAVVGRPVKRLNTVGLSYVVMLAPPPKPPPWPARVDLPDMAPQADPWAWPFGVTRDGRHIWASLARTSHLLIAGKSGSGKSTAVNAGLVALLRAHDPRELRMILIDGKGGVELWPYNGVPHLALPVATTPEDAAAALAWLVNEVGRREAIFRAAGVRSLRAYNAAARGVDPLPLVAAVIDEVTDLVMLWGGPRSAPFADLARLASKARAFGVILVMSTQNPRADVLDTLVRENAGVRVAFKVDTATQSRMILGLAGAEAIPPARPGRCLVAGLADVPQVLQGYAVTDDAVTGLVRGLRAIVAPVLTALEQSLVAYARDELGGAFTLHPLAVAFAGRVSLRRLQHLARSWELRGWLTAPVDAVSPRRLTDDILTLAVGVRAENTVTGLQGLQAVTGAEDRLQGRLQAVIGAQP